MTKTVTSLYAVLFLFISLFVLKAHAVGLSVSPKELKISVAIGETAVQKLKITNPSKEVAVFEAYPDDFENMIKLSPSSFILESEESREVTVQISPKEQGVFKTNISVVASSITGSAFNAGGGVKIPTEISVSENSSRLLAALYLLPLTYGKISGIILAVALMALIFLGIKYGISKI